MATFLSLVNDCIDESKQALDNLDSANFANPPRTVLYNRLKRWVSQSYADLMEERKEWFFTNERGVVTVQPRLHLAKLDELYFPEVGDILIGDQSEVVFVITEVFTDNEGQDTLDEATVGVVYEDDNGGELIQWESFSVVRDLEDFTSAGRIENRGLYDVSQYIPTLDHIDMNSVTIKRSVFDPDFADDRSSSMLPLRYISWPQYLRQYENFYNSPGTPRFIAEAPNGDLQLFPFPDGLYDLSFDYTQKAPALVEWDDEPSLLPEKHQSILVWKALVELADFNNDRALYARANKKYMERLGWLMRDYLPEVTFGTSLFYRN